MIKHLPVSYPTLGRIRLGSKVKKTSKSGKSYEQPEKGETLRFSSNDRGYLEVLADRLGGEVVDWEDGEQLYQLTTESAFVPALLPPDPIDTTYERWGKGGIAKRCDGETALIPVIDGEGGYLEERPCVCRAEGAVPGDKDDIKNKGACQVTVRIRLVLPDVPGIGIWLCTSHSVYAAMELPGQIALLQTIQAKGILVPAEFGIEKRTEKKPWEKFARDFIVPVLRIRASLAELAGEVPAASPLLQVNGQAKAVEASVRAALEAGGGWWGGWASETEFEEVTQPAFDWLKTADPETTMAARAWKAKHGVEGMKFTRSQFGEFAAFVAGIRRDMANETLDGIEADLAKLPRAHESPVEAPVGVPGGLCEGCGAESCACPF